MEIGEVFFPLLLVFAKRVLNVARNAAAKKLVQRAPANWAGCPGIAIEAETCRYSTWRKTWLTQRCLTSKMWVRWVISDVSGVWHDALMRSNILIN
ncbi:hypothetical protein [uncultured Roseobacter sp.]|uniref:hypothetical protein n=1 Tax=uncultured Roseobacter sp. TaxID=114847 RepID=UPI002626BB32|nr:hypothetical protein [uncultured Roseobacter sp.]